MNTITFPDLSRFDLLADHSSGCVVSNIFENYLLPEVLFFRVNGFLPWQKIFDNLHRESFFKDFKENLAQHQLNPVNLIEGIVMSDYTKKEYNTNYFLVFLAKDFIISDSLVDDDSGLVLHYDPLKYDEDYVQTFVSYINTFYTDIKHDTTDGKALFYTATKNFFSIELTKHEIECPKINFDLNYNEDFDAQRVIIENTLRSEDHGLIMLHGTPGTGKTTYIRYLSSIINKKFIFLTNELARDVSSSDFVDMLISNPNSILVIEDGEYLIQAGSHKNLSLASLLNLTDGLLTDFLKIQAIFTFNTEVRKIDSALLRKGRLSCLYHFKPLAADKAQALSNHLGFDSVITEPMTLADIYNQNEMEFKTKKKRIGFINY